MTATAVKVCWHGSASVSLRVYGQEFLFDPCFSCPGERQPDLTANPYAPTPAKYLTKHWPDLCLITDGRSDHCDAPTLRHLGMLRTGIRFLANDPVAEALLRLCAPDAACIWPTEPGDVHHIGQVRIETFSGSWKFAREPSRGASLPADGDEHYRTVGPTLGFHLSSGEDRVYVGGNDSIADVPQIDAGIALLAVGGRVRTPADHGPLLALSEVSAALGRLSARVVVPLHWDFHGLTAPCDPAELRERLSREMPAVKVVVPPYNEWITIEA